MKTKRFKFGVSWQMHGTQWVEVPAGFTIEEAIERVRDIWHEIELPRGEYVPDSDQPDFEDEVCGFMD